MDYDRSYDYKAVIVLATDRDRVNTHSKNNEPAHQIYHTTNAKKDTVIILIQRQAHKKRKQISGLSLKLFLSTIIIGILRMTEDTFVTITRGIERLNNNEL